MTKKEVTWLIIRLLGICSIFNAFRYFFIIIENWLLASSAELGEATISQSSGLFMGWTIELIFYFIIGLYLLFNGKLLFFVLNRESE